MKRLLNLILLILALLAFTPGLAAAHAEVEKSTPADGARIALSQAPTKVTLTMTEELAREGNTISVTANGTNYASGPAVADFDNPKLVTVNLNPLKAGTYTVKWHTVTAEDTGGSDGQFTFTITDDRAPASTNAGGTTTNPPVETNTTSAGGNSTLPPTGNGDGQGTWALVLSGAALLVGLGFTLRRQVRA